MEIACKNCGMSGCIVEEYCNGKITIICGNCDNVLERSRVFRVPKKGVSRLDKKYMEVQK